MSTDLLPGENTFMMFQVPFGFPCCFWNVDEKFWQIMACLLVLNLSLQFVSLYFFLLNLIIN